MNVEELVRKMAKICFSHQVSDNTVEDLFFMFCANAKDISFLLEAGRLTPSWRHFLRPRALLQCPKIYCAYLVERAHGGEVTLLYDDEMEKIPKEILSLAHDGARRLLRTSAYVKLSDIKQHHKTLHCRLGISPEKTKYDLLHAHISADGVRESQKGTRTLIILSVCFGECIYLHSVLNPLIGVPASCPSPTELLGYEEI